jgi:Zn-dependent peptidase ImmA (M78 family)/transcriptional regulator with XRE-family HTH domain
MMVMIGSRIRLAREIAGMTQAELALRIDTTQSGVASMEGNLYRPSDELIRMIADVSGFRPSFFARSTEEFPSGALLYRSRATVPKIVRQRAHGLTTLAYEMATVLGDRLKKVPVNLPRLTEDPIRAAQITRAAFGLAPAVPITDLLSRCETNGVLVLWIPFEVESLDGFSTWVGVNSPRPVMAILGGKVGYRTNFTIAEELGHLVLHSPLRTTIADAEIEAKAFAQEFLMPSEAMHEEIQMPVTLSSLAPLKNRWKASLQALIRRAKDLGYITANQYRYLNQQIRVNGWAKAEPGDESIPQQKPRLLRKMAELLYGIPINFRKLSEDTGISEDLLAEILCMETPKKAGKLLQFKVSSVQDNGSCESESDRSLETVSQ